MRFKFYKKILLALLISIVGICTINVQEASATEWYDLPEDNWFSNGEIVGNGLYRCISGSPAPDGNIHVVYWEDNDVWNYEHPSYGEGYTKLTGYVYDLNGKELRHYTHYVNVALGESNGYNYRASSYWIVPSSNMTTAISVGWGHDACYGGEYHGLRLPLLWDSGKEQYFCKDYAGSEMDGLNIWDPDKNHGEGGYATNWHIGCDGRYVYIYDSDYYSHFPLEGKGKKIYCLNNSSSNSMYTQTKESAISSNFGRSLLPGTTDIYYDYSYNLNGKTVYYIISTNCTLVPVNAAPTLTLSAPINSSYLSSSISLAGTVKDGDNGDVVKVYCSIGSKKELITTLTANGSNQSFSYNLSSSGLSDGTQTLKVWAEDSKGDKSTEVARTLIVDKTAPVISIGDYTKAPTNKDITVTAKVNEGSLNATSHTFTVNGSFTFTAIDSAGNKTTKTVTISNIDKVKPKLKIIVGN